MRLSQLCTHTMKEPPKGEVSRNARLLTQAGYVSRLMAGVYSYLPLGLRTLNKIETIIREEMNALGGQEVLMPALQPRENWETTGRWDKVDVLYKLGSGPIEKPEDYNLALGPTHEEIVTPLIANFVHSYRDLPVAVYQLQTKFRNEPRPKSGLLRGREFRMKDLYSFHADQNDLDSFYERSIQAYHSVYRRCGIGDKTLLTYASGGIFSKYSHEFQTLTPHGEDTVYRIAGTSIAINKEIIGDQEALREIIPNYQTGDEDRLEELKAIEVGNIFKLGSRFTEAFRSSFADKTGSQGKIVMGCYGMGPSRIMGTIVECLSDDKGLVWPEEIAPYTLGLLNLKHDDAETKRFCDALYEKLSSANVDVLYDDRSESAGVKFADMDLLGLPWQLIVGPRSFEQGLVELKCRATDKRATLAVDEVFEKLRNGNITL